MEKLENEIQNLKNRNKRVERDKAWEVSWTRRVFIAALTYLIAAIWLYMIREQAIWFKAVVPTAGYILSTLTIPQLKKLWISQKNAGSNRV
ncbi:MAG: hypothetical protein AAB635_01610 [Patescibacteria group bacterium]